MPSIGQDLLEIVQPSFDLIVHLIAYLIDYLLGFLFSNYSEKKGVNYWMRKHSQAGSSLSPLFYLVPEGSSKKEESETSRLGYASSFLLDPSGTLSATPLWRSLSITWGTAEISLIIEKKNKIVQYLDEHCSGLVGSDSSGWIPSR